MSNLQQIIQKQLGQNSYTGKGYQDMSSTYQNQHLITKKIYDRLQTKLKQNNFEFLSNYTNVNSSQPKKQQFQQQISCKKQNINNQNEQLELISQQHQLTSANSTIKIMASAVNQNAQMKNQSNSQQSQQQMLDNYNYSVQQSIQLLGKYDRQLKQKQKINQNVNSNQTGQSFFSTKPCSARTNIHNRTQSLAAANNNNVLETNNNFSYCSPRVIKDNNSIISSARSIVPAQNFSLKEQKLITHQSEDFERQQQLVLLVQSQTKSKKNIQKDNSEQEQQIKITPFLEERIYHDRPLSRASSTHSINLQNHLNREQQIKTSSQKSRISQQEITRPQSSFSQNKLLFNNSQIQNFNEQIYKKNNYVQEEEENKEYLNETQQILDERQARNILKSVNLNRRSLNNLVPNNSMISTKNENLNKDVSKIIQKPLQQKQGKSISLNSKLTLEEKQEMYKVKRKKQSDVLPFLEYKGEESLKFLHMYLYLNKNEILNMIYNFAEYSTQLEGVVWEIVTKAVESSQLKILAKILIFVGQIQIAVGNLDKAAYFLNQAKICCEMNKGSDYLKSLAYLLLGDICIYQTKYSESLLFYKKSLQYAWYCNAKNQEIDLYDKLGIAYYYLQELNKSQIFHQRSMVAEYEDINSHLRRISNEVTQEVRKNQKEDHKQINYVVFAHLSLPLNLAQMDFFMSPRHSNYGLIASNNFQLQTEQQYRSDLGQKKEQKLLFTSLNKNYSQNNTNVGQVNNDVTLISNTSMFVDSVNYKSQHQSHSSRRPSTSIKQTKQTPHYQLKQQYSHDDEDCYNETPKNKDEQEDWLQHEGTARMKKQLYEKASVDSIVEHILKDNDFIFQMSTPKHSAKIENSQQQESSKFRIHREKYENSNLNRSNYDIKNFGVISNSQSSRKFDDITLYKFPLEKKIEILKSQNFDLNQVWHRINRAVASSQRFNQQLNDRIRVNQNTPNRCAANYKSFPKITYNKIKSIYEKLLNEFEVRNDNANQ